MDEPQPSLHSLGGSAPPADLAVDLRALVALPSGAQRNLWEALGPVLAEPISADVEARLTAFCARHQAADGDLARSLKACRFLLRSAVKLGVDQERFAADLDALGGDDAPRLRALLLPGFDAARRFVREEIVRRTLAEHGKLVEGVDWRVEQLVASNHGDGVDQRVAAVTLRFSEGDRRERITLYFTPEMLAELARAHARLRA